MRDERAFLDLKRVTWKIIAAAKNAMRYLPEEERIKLLAEVTAAEELLGKIVTREGKVDGQPAGADLKK